MGFSVSTTREPIYDGFSRLRREAETLGIPATQWIDGSYVETKDDPRDVDVVTFCDYDYLIGASSSIKAFVETCLNGAEKTRVTYSTHTFLVPSCPPGHGFYNVFERWRAYWREWFGGTRQESDQQQRYLKGIVEMTMGPAESAPRIRAERSRA